MSLHSPLARPLRLLEVGAMPFPTSQGTQALVREQCEALASRGHDVHLLVYAHGASGYRPSYTIHRLGDWPRERAVRSGPSWRKVILDVRLGAAVRRLAKELRPDLIHAHNYEALVACLAARPSPPLVYHAHTLFGYELPTFVSGPARSLLARASGSLADRLLPPRASSTLAVSPRLVDELVLRGHPPHKIECSLPGIDIPDVELDGERQRRRLGLVHDEVVGYCGNLDAYQGLETLLDAISVLLSKRPKVTLLVITASASGPLSDAAKALGIEDRLRFADHGDFANALELLAAAHVCVVPRSTPGGFPIKLLSYLAAGRPIVTTRGGAAGLELGEALSVVPDSDSIAMADAVERLLEHPKEARDLGRRGHALVRRYFTWEVAGANLESQLRKVVSQSLD